MLNLASIAAFCSKFLAFVSGLCGELVCAAKVKPKKGERAVA